MSHEIKPKDLGGQPLVEVQLSQTQLRAFASLLPHGYTLEAMSKVKKDKVSSQKKPSKKIITNDGNVVRKNGYTQNEPTPNSTYSETVTPSTKRSLRDHRKKSQTYLEEKFGEIAPPPATSSKAPAKPMGDAIKKCHNLLQRLKKHNCAGPFLLPVDVEGLGLYDYYDVVGEPMDLSTVEKKLKNGEYSSVHEFGADIRKIWTNATTYNAEGSSIYNMTIKMSVYFEKIFKEIEDVQFNDKVRSLEAKLKELTRQISDLTQQQVQPLPPPPTNTKASSHRSGTKPAKSPNTAPEDPMTIHEKKVLCDNIKKLQPDALRGVWDIVSKGLPNAQNTKEELVFDIDSLPVKITRELDRYVKQKLGTTKQTKGKGKDNSARTQSLRVESAGYGQHPTQTKQSDNKHNSMPPLVMPDEGTGGHKKAKDDDAMSKSSDSSFISDSESGSDDERNHKSKPVT